MSVEAAPSEGTHLDERHKQLQEGQEGIPPSERVNHTLREEVQAPIREEGQRQARCKGIIQTGGSRAASWTTSTSSTFNLVSAADIIDTVAPDTTTS